MRFLSVIGWGERKKKKKKKKMMLRNVGVKRENFVVAAFSAHKGKVKIIWKEVK